MKKKTCENMKIIKIFEKLFSIAFKKMTYYQRFGKEVISFFNLM